MDDRVDRQAQDIIAFLRDEGAADRRHSSAATLLDHLTGTYAIVRRWKQPVWLQHAALIHSVYGTEAYRAQLLPASRRDAVAELAGERAERLAYLFGTTPRETLLADGGAASDERDALVLLHMANLAEQARGRDGSPGRWLVRVAEVAEPLIESAVVSLPLFIAQLAAFSEADERLTRRAYLDGIRAAGDLETRLNRLAVAAATCPVVAEPCVWLAHSARSRGDLDAARHWAERAIRRLLELGATWDKRLGFEEWLELAEALERPLDRARAPRADGITHPRVLFEAVQRQSAEPGSTGSPPPPGVTPAPPPEEPAATPRFQRYVESLGQADGSALGAVYPELLSRPWLEPEAFPLVRYLESHYDAIRDEILSLEPTRFHRESERIERSGNWDVAFFYERGRRHDGVCLACPVTTRGIEAYPTVRTLAGLIYASRMRGSTHIRPHRGPTNLRVRCHLALQVPEGDCGIRVGGETRRWQEGRCLVFDDFLEHEAWNRTDEDRIVLVVDLWHPGLTAAEVELLEGLQRYAYGHAERLDRYWAANAAAAGEAGVINA